MKAQTNKKKFHHNVSPSKNAWPLTRPIFQCISWIRCCRTAIQPFRWQYRHCHPADRNQFGRESMFELHLLLMHFVFCDRPFVIWIPPEELLQNWPYLLVWCVLSDSIGVNKTMTILYRSNIWGKFGSEINCNFRIQIVTLMGAGKCQQMNYLLMRRWHIILMNWRTKFRCRIFAVAPKLCICSIRFCFLGEFNNRFNRI